MGLPSTALGHQVGFEAQRAGPPTHVYIGQEDWASVTAYNAVAGATFSVFLRILTPQGIVVPFEDDYSPAATRAAVTNDRPLTEGYLLSATVRTTGKTGVEMEALTAVAVAALTVYDMAKAVQRDMRIGDIRLVRKRGGKSGEIVLE